MDRLAGVGKRELALTSSNLHICIIVAILAILGVLGARATDYGRLDSEN